MTRNDIDVALRTPRPSFTLVLDLVTRLRERGFNNYWLFDNLENGWPEDPRHIICEAWYGFYDTRVPDDDRWSVGIAIATPEEAERVMALTLRVERAITNNPELRAAILRLKFGLAAKYGPKRFTGKQVYEAVLDDGVRTIEEFEQLQESRATV
ncbi:MAG: hypothetical protein AB7R89_23130 [Dehalococcoidia bacterium]